MLFGPNELPSSMPTKNGVFGSGTGGSPGGTYCGRDDDAVAEIPPAALPGTGRSILSALIELVAVEAAALSQGFALSVVEEIFGHHEHGLGRVRATRLPRQSERAAIRARHATLADDSRRSQPRTPSRDNAAPSVSSASDAGSGTESPSAPLPMAIDASLMIRKSNKSITPLRLTSPFKCVPGSPTPKPLSSPTFVFQTL